MRYRDAARLTNGSEVKLKSSGRVIHVSEVEPRKDYKTVFIWGTDGRIYTHDEVC